MKRIFPLVFILLLAIPAISQVKKAQPGSGEKKTIAVMNFTNYGAANIAFLSNALPESVSATLSESSSVRVVERSQLGKIIQEITLEQSGLIDTDEVTRAGRMAKADFLLIGSLSGDTKQVIVTLKAVEVTTGKSVAGRVVKGPVGEIFELSGQAARSMTAIVSGEGVGTLTVITTPAGSDVYIDGMLAGKSPVIEFKVTEGEHRIRTVLPEYIDYEGSVHVEADRHETSDHMLAEAKLKKRGFIGLYADYFWPVHDEVHGGPHFALIAGQHFGMLAFQGELGFAKVEQDQTMPTYYGGIEEMERYYDFATLNGVIFFTPFQSWEYISPYVGGLLGYTFLSDRRPKKGADELLFNDTEEFDKFHRMALGLVGGVTILPWSSVSIFIEARYIIHPFKIERQLYEKPVGGGEALYKTDKFFLTMLTIGGGIKTYF